MPREIILVGQKQNVKLTAPVPGTVAGGRRHLDNLKKPRDQESGSKKVFLINAFEIFQISIC